MTCPHCSAQLRLAENVTGLVTMVLLSDGATPVNAGTVLPVSTYVCQECGHLEFRLEQPSITH